MQGATAVEAPPGRAWSAAWTDRVDGAIRENLARLVGGEGGSGLAVVALGSYARRRLCPGSDIDVLLLHDGWGNKGLQSLVEAVCYPLWDSGLSVGHGVLTAGEAVRGAAESIDRATSLTDRRLVAGDAGLVDDLAARTARFVRRRRPHLLRSLADADAARHQRSGPEPGMLEPDLKNGSGGLRDVDSLRWAAAFLLGEPTLAALVGARYLGAGEHRQVQEAATTLHAVRCALHLVSEARRPAAGVDVLRLDVQDEVADRLGLDSGDAVLRTTGLAARVVRSVHGRAWPRLLEDARSGRRRRRPASSIDVDRDVALVDGAVEVTAGAELAADHALALRAVAAAAVHGTVIGRASAERLGRQVAQVGVLDWSGAARSALLSTLRQGFRGLPALADADRLGVFEAMLPGWDRVRGHPQRNPYHRFDLDTHLARSVAELVDLAGGSADPRHAAIAERLSSPDVVLLATLLHDVGKPWPGDHSVVGAERAAALVRHMGFGDARARRVARLVRHHLLLPLVATRRDLDDAAEIRRVAELVEDTETLDGLYLLSLADARATGPTVWSSWKDSLLSELHARARAHLMGGPAALARLAGPDVVLADARQAAGQEAVEALVDGLPRRYALAATAEQVTAHIELLDAFHAASDRSIVASWRPGPAPTTAVVSVIAHDRPGLVADCAGVLAGYGVPVHEARAFTRADRLAFDWFVVGTEDRATGTRILPSAVIDAFDRLGAGTLDVAELVARRERRRDERVVGPRPPVEVDIAVSSPRVRIEVSGPDAPGLLYRLAGTIAAAGLDLTGARAASLQGEVHDVFFVAAPVGEREEQQWDPGRWDALAELLRAAVDSAVADSRSRTEARPGS